jgi:hypothetical protein
MSDTVETVTVKVSGHPDGHTVINKSEFDADKLLKDGDPEKKNYELWVAPKEKPEKKAEGAKTEGGTPITVKG